MAEPRRIANTITGAVTGHAVQIGVLNGDVLLERPEYRLQLVTPGGPAPHVPRSRRGPSYLLDPRREVVPFHDRPAQIGALADWVNDDEPVSLTLLHGPGGAGKTRLAGWLASQAIAAGWVVAEAGESPARLPRARHGGQPDDAAPLFVVVDYADRWPLRTLAVLLTALPVDHPRRRIRILLLARPGSRLMTSLDAELARAPIDLAGTVELAAFTPDPERAYAEAAAAFTRALALPHPRSAPAPFTGPADATALVVHMAALAAVWAGRDGAVPATADLSRYLLGHERRCWGDTDPRVEPALFVATLFGPAADRPSARALLRAAALADGDADADTLLGALERLYPQPASVAQPEVLSPLRPDRLGEDFAAECLADHANASRVHDLVARHDLSPQDIRRCLTVLLAGAARHLAAGRLLLDLAQRAPHLFRHAPAAAIEHVTRHAEHDVAIAVSRALPDHSTELLAAAASLTGRVVAELPAQADAAIRAEHLGRHSVRLAAVGRRAEAVTAAQTAVDLCRELAAVDRAAHLPELAEAVNNLAVDLAAVGRRAEGLAAAGEAVDLRRELVALDRDEHLAGLANSVNNLAIRLGEAGRRAEGLAAAREAVDLFRELVAADRDTYLPGLAGAVNNLAVDLADAGRHADGLAAAHEAAELYRELARADRDAYVPDLAMSLNNLAVRLADAERDTEALAAAQEAVTLRRELVAVSRAAYLANLATSLSNVANRLGNAGRHAEGLAAAQEAMALRRELVALNRDAHLPDLAMSMNTVALGLDSTGRHAEALAAADEAVTLYSELAADNRAAHLPNLATSVSNLAHHFANADRLADAVTVARDAVALCRELVAAEPGVFDDRLAAAERSLADWMSTISRRAQAPGC